MSIGLCLRLFLANLLISEVSDDSYVFWSYDEDETELVSLPLLPRLCLTNFYRDELAIEFELL